MGHSWSSFITWSQEALSRTPVETAEVQVVSNLDGVSPVSPALHYSSSSRDEQNDTTLDTEDIVQANVEQSGVTLAGSTEAVVREQAPHQSHESDNFDTCCSASSRWGVFVLAILLGVAAIAVGVAVVTVGNKNDSASPVVVIVPPGNNTVDGGYLQEIRAILVPPNLWGDPTAAQLRAVEYMAYAGSNRVNVTSPRLRQRYAMLVLYFANGGDRWPINPARHECDWTFVVCNNQSVVTKLYMGSQLDMKDGTSSCRNWTLDSAWYVL